MEAAVHFCCHYILQLPVRNRIRSVLKCYCISKYHRILITPPLSAIVFPTLWEYLQSLGVSASQTYYLGLCVAGKSFELCRYQWGFEKGIKCIFISALSFTDIVASLLAGRWADKFSRVSYLLLSLTLTEVIASVLYLVAREEWIQFKYLRRSFYSLEFIS